MLRDPSPGVGEGVDDLPSVALLDLQQVVRQQSFGRLKESMEGILGERFELRDGRRAYGQRMLDAGYSIELVSKSMGHVTIETTQKFYADYQERNVLDCIFQMKNDQKIGTRA